MENRPFTLVHGDWYKLMMNKIQENWIPPDHKTLDKYLDEFYVEFTDIVKQKLKNVKFMCQTADGWKSRTLDHYYC